MHISRDVYDMSVINYVEAQLRVSVTTHTVADLGALQNQSHERLD